MTTDRGRGRPRLTDEQAWWSLRKRAFSHIEEVKRTECQRWVGPPTLHIAGDRGVISPTNFILAELGEDLCWNIVAARTCRTRLCLEPDHWQVLKLEARNPYASWHPHPIPGESPEDRTARELAEKKAKEWTGIRG